jgi:hypothetical protein
MPAGRELDALIAAKVFGRAVSWLPTSLSPSAPHAQPDDACGLYPISYYSTDVDAALDALAQVGGIVTITRVWPAEWRVALGRHTWWAETLPLAICRTLLAAVSTTAPSDELAAVREAETECHAEERADA